MKNKYIKIGLFILVPIILLLIGFYIYAMIMAFGNQRMPVVNVSKELKGLEKIIQTETKGGSIYIYPVAEHKIKNCNANLNMDLSIRNDSITHSKESLDNYINSINKRIYEKLTNKECIDSLIMDVSSYYSKEPIDSLKSKNYRYSFPVK